MSSSDPLAQAFLHLYPALPCHGDASQPNTPRARVIAEAEREIASFQTNRDQCGYTFFVAQRGRGDRSRGRPRACSTITLASRVAPVCGRDSLLRQSPAVPLSRRTWLWTSAAALASACARPTATRVPEQGAEGARELTRRGAENLLALAELGAAIRWLHPSDGVVETAWEPLLLEGVRGLEHAGTRTELVEGLRGLFGELAPTVLIWRAHQLDEGAELDEPACVDPETEAQPAGGTHAAKGASASAPGPSEAATGHAAEATSEGADGVPAKEVEEAAASEPDGTASKSDGTASKSDGTASESDGTASESDDAASETDDTTSGLDDATTELDDTASESDDAVSEPDDTASEPDDTASELDETTSEPESAAAGKPEAAPPPNAAPGENAAALKPAPPPPEPDPHAASEARPPLHEALFARGDESLSIVQWHRRGYVDGLDDEAGCAQRVVHAPDTSHVCTTARARRRIRRTHCSACDAAHAPALAPAAPLRVELPRGLAAMIPLALWSREHRTLPATQPREPAPPFGEAQAREYSLDDRATRLLAVLHSYSLLRRFYPQPSADPRPLLLASLCAAAEDPSPIALRETIETLLAGFGDGNAELIVSAGRAARRFVPPLSLAWVEQRVVVASSQIEQVQPGDVITAIDGVSIDTVLAEQLLRSPAASASAAIVRVVAQLLARARKGTTIELQLARTDPSEAELSVLVNADRRSDRKPLLADARPQAPLLELEEGIVYVDATRLPRLDRAARRLRRAEHAIIDLRGELADARGSLLAHFLSEPQLLARERMPTGPDPRGALPLEPVGELRVEPARPRLSARLAILADARTRGRAELELLGFDQLGAALIGSASAGDLGRVATAWLPGGWQLRFTHSELRSRDGTPLHGVGIRPSTPIEPTRASLRAGIDPLLAAALAQAKGSPP